MIDVTILLLLYIVAVVTVIVSCFDYAICNLRLVPNEPLSLNDLSLGFGCNDQNRTLGYVILTLNPKP